MFNDILNTVKECEKICNDPVVKEKLIKVQQDVEDIYTGDEYKTRNYLTPDEMVKEQLNKILHSGNLY